MGKSNLFQLYVEVGGKTQMVVKTNNLSVLLARGGKYGEFHIDQRNLRIGRNDCFIDETPALLVCS